jgi:hypothetical protein
MCGDQIDSRYQVEAHKPCLLRYELGEFEHGSAAAPTGVFSAIAQTDYPCLTQPNWEFAQQL